MGRSVLCSLGVCHIRGYVIRDYVAFMIMLNWFSVVWDCVVAVNVARVNVVRDYVVWYTVGVSFPSGRHTYVGFASQILDWCWCECECVSV